MGKDRSGFWAPFLLGAVAGGSAAALAVVSRLRSRIDHRLIKWPREHLTPVVVVPGIMGSGLVRPDGLRAWLSWGNAMGTHELALPCMLPLSESRDDLLPSGLLGTEGLLPRLFGFTEYGDLLQLLRDAGFRGRGPGVDRRPTYHIFSYDWRRDLIESARRLEETLDALADNLNDPAARFNVIGHSMGGLVARYYLRYGGVEPQEGRPVTWAGARRIRNLVLVAVPNAGSIAALDGVFNGSRVGLSATTLAGSVIGRMPAIYQLLPPAGAPALVDPHGRAVELDLHDPEVWRRQQWGAFGPGNGQRRRSASRTEEHIAFVEASLHRARLFHAALAQRPEAPCPVRVIALGGDCLPTLARAVMPDRPGQAPRFAPLSPIENEAMFEAGDGRVTRASVLGSHLPAADEEGGGVPEVAHAFFGSADHHGIYKERTFQSILLRLLLRPPPSTAGAS